VQRGAIPIGASLGLIAATTGILWHLKTTAHSQHLVYLYLLPVILIAVLHTGRLALFCAAIAMVCADYFLQDPLFSLANSDPLEYGDLIWFAVLAAMSIKCIRVLIRPRTKPLKADRRP
jgi:K+-sensing histidine kinase KdpD